MINILADATLPGIQSTFFEPFVVSTYATKEDLLQQLPFHDVLICRSTLSVNEALLNNSHLSAVATASSGVDHIDDIYLAQHDIQLFDAKSSNAIAVTDYVVSSLAYLEKQALIKGKRAGVIGVGEVGSRVVKRLQAAGFDVIKYDPIKYGSQHSTLDDLSSCDLIAVHANWHKTPPYPTHHLINQHFLEQLREGTVIINASRGHIVDEAALLKSPKKLIYCTDVYVNEPDINAQLVEYATLCTPHIAGHSIEAKHRAIKMLRDKLYAFYGIIHPLVAPNLVDLPPLPLSSWQEIVLDLYNPLIDTGIIKTACDKKHAFLSQRQAHLFRHDYACYGASHLPVTTQHMLGS